MGNNLNVILVLLNQALSKSKLSDKEISCVISECKTNAMSNAYKSIDWALHWDKTTVGYTECLKLQILWCIYLFKYCHWYFRGELKQYASGYIHELVTEYGCDGEEKPNELEAKELEKVKQFASTFLNHSR